MCVCAREGERTREYVRIWERCIEHVIFHSSHLTSVLLANSSSACTDGPTNVSPADTTWGWPGEADSMIVDGEHSSERDIGSEEVFVRSKKKGGFCDLIGKSCAFAKEAVARVDRVTTWPYG